MVLAWAYNAPRLPILDALEHLTGYIDDDDDVPVNREWVEDQLDIADASGIGAPCSRGGYDPLHLTGHISGPLEQPGGPVRVLHSNPADRHAVIVLSSMIGWYRALAETAAGLPDIGKKSWHVDVFARPVGHLGTYRRSHVSGLWFAGRHRWHEPGYEDSLGI